MLNISRCKGNQTMKYGQLAEYNIRNIFIEKPYVECGGKACPRKACSFQNIKVEHISQWTVWIFILFVYCMYYRKAIEIWLKLRWKPLAFASYKVSLKRQKEVWNYSPCLIFYMIFEENYFPVLCSVNWPNFII